MAPAELEGHLLNHPDVADCCVVGVPDDYSGELPLAFVALSEAAQERVKTSQLSPAEAERIKAALIKVGHLSLQSSRLQTPISRILPLVPDSTSPTRRWNTNGLQAVWSSLTLSRKIQAESC